jgi:serine/threonine protein kinase
MDRAKAEPDDIFCDALELASSAERAAYLDRACGGDADLRRRVERLLQAHAEADSFLAAGPSVAAATTELVADAPGTAIGPYKLLEQIGEGGMGTVWMAQQTEPVKRLVAVKLIKAGMDSRQVIARFEAERQALALMDHAHIARVLDAGTTKGEPGGMSPGRPYFVMDLVKGVPITRYCDEHRLTPRQRLELFLPVCQAIQHAHQKGIIHRDLKPSNVLVALYDGRPVPKVIDFGVAKAAGQTLTDKTLVTGFGAIVGTLEYMSPEQAEINQLDIDTRSDIYALGVLLYELLAGTPPFTRKRSERGGILEMLRVIREQEPTKPSTRLSTADGLPTLAANRGTEPAKLTRLVRGELDWIVMKALEKDRNRRYETASALARDLERYLHDEPVLACPPSAWYRFQKFARRNKAALLTAALVSAALVLVVIGLAVSNARISQEKNEKEAALEAAEANLRLARQAVDEMYVQVAGDLGRMPHMLPYQREVLQRALRFYQELARRKSRDSAIRLESAHALLRVGSITYSFKQRRQGEKCCRDALAELELLAGELPSDPQRRFLLSEAYSVVANLHASAGRRQQAEETCRQAAGLLEQLAARPDKPEYRSRLAQVYHALGNLLQHRPREAEKKYRAAIKLCEQLVAESPLVPSYRADLVYSYSDLSVLLCNTGQRQQAEQALRKVIELYEKDRGPLERSGYGYPRIYAEYVLGDVLAAGGRAEEAEREYRQAIAGMERLVWLFPDLPNYRHTLAIYRARLAKFIADQGRPQEAAVSRGAARELIVKLLAEFPEDAGEEMPLFDAWTLREAGLLQAAEPGSRKALARAKKLADEHSGEPVYRDRLAQGHLNLGTLLQRAGRRREAADEFRQGLAVYDQLVKEYPGEPGYRHLRANARNALGIVLRALPGEVEAAIHHHRQAVAECKQLVVEFPDQPKYRFEQLVRGHYGLGVALMLAGRWGEAESAYVEALAASEPLTDAAGTLYDRFRLASICNDLAWLRATWPDAALRDPGSAVELARKAVKFYPKMPGYLNTLGVAYYRAGQWQKSKEALEKSMRFWDGNCESFNTFFLAMVHWRQGEREEARKWYGQAVAWMEKNKPQDEELRRFRAEAAELLMMDHKDTKSTRKKVLR